jgi:NAD(P)-dependent dehydrogenase (short-subunit alcohol dehydrogenase family)
MTVTLITGTSTGIGHACSLYFARKGHHVFASMRNPDSGGGPLREAADAEGLKLDVIRVDVEDDATVKAGVGEVLERAGRVDLLVNNAGIGPTGNVETMPDDLWHSVLDINLMGAIRMCRAVLPGMRAQGSGTIVNVTSVAGRMAQSPQAAYAASKFALEAVSEVLAQEVRRYGIRVIVIEPGVIMSSVWEKNFAVPDKESPYVEFDYRAGQIFMKRLADPGPPELVAEVIDQALSDESPKLRYVVGWDADAWITGRAAMTDEEWVDAGRPMSKEEFTSFYRERFGIDLA